MMDKGASDTKTLFMDVKKGEVLSFDGGRVRITLEEKSGQRAKLKIEHDGVLVERRATPRQKAA